MTFIKKIAETQGVGQSARASLKGMLRASFFVKRTAGADRTVKILGTLKDAGAPATDHTDLGLTFTFDANNNAFAKFEGILTSLMVDVSGGTAGTYDVWMGGSDS